MMARHEVEREDLLRDATAYRSRCRFHQSGCDDWVFVGLRDDDTFSIYFHDDPVYHFDPHGRLRRAFVDGRLYRSQEDTITRLTRVRTDAETQLQSHLLDDGELEQFLCQMDARCRILLDTLQPADDQTIAVEHLESVGDWSEPLPVIARLLERMLACNPRLAPAIATKRTRKPSRG